MTAVRSIGEHRIRNSRVHPTIEIEVTLENERCGCAIAPVDASREASGLRDGGAAFARTRWGKGRNVGTSDR